MAAADFQVVGRNANAPFTLKVHRGEGMALLAMNWRNGTPPDDFVGFAISYREPGSDRFFVLQNRLNFPTAAGRVDPQSHPTTVSPIQKFRWVHFPRNAERRGDFVYRVIPVFMSTSDDLSFGEAQEVSLELRRETYPRKLNVAFTRGYVSSQAFVDRFASQGPISTLLPANADDGLRFPLTHPAAAEALPWMGFEARDAILEVLDQAIADDKAQVEVIAYDLNEPEIVSRLVRLGDRVRVIIDNDGAHGEPGSAEKQAEDMLVASAGRDNVKRQHMAQLQHNKTIVVDGPKVRAVVCGSTNFSWRGFYVQANNAVVLRGRKPVDVFHAAFAAYWGTDDAKRFGGEPPAVFQDLQLTDIDARAAFSPHTKENALLDTIARDIAPGATSSLLYSLAFLYQTKGPIRDAIEHVTNDPAIFVYGMSDKRVGLELQKPDGNIEPVNPSQLTKNVPEPFKSEPSGGSGVRMHHKFLVIDFDKPTARVYLGSYNFSKPADLQNGENLLLIRDRRIAVAYMVEALRLFDYYHFRVAQRDARKARDRLLLAKPPRNAGDVAWWQEDYTVPVKIRDRELFA
jgi:phosphatidylserine/phosphatidylglycerophosphate/cardiolipin synthase-like enzyme